MGSHLASAKNHLFFFSWNGVQRTLELQRRGAGRGPAAGHGLLGPAQGSCREEGSRQRLEGHVLCRVALQDCHLYRWQGVSRHIEAAQHLKGTSRRCQTSCASFWTPVSVGLRPASVGPAFRVHEHLRPGARALLQPT